MSLAVPPITQAPTLSGREFAAIRRVVAHEVGIDLPDAKRSLVVARLGPRLRQLGLASFADYVEKLDAAAERAELVERITTHETRFFRDPEQYAFLASHVLETHRALGRPIRVWCAACSTGEEPYALLLQTLATAGDDAIEILATDVSRRVLETARAGIYPSQRLADIPTPLRDAYLLRGVGPREGTFCVAASVRQRLTLGRFNLVRDAAHSLDALLPMRGRPPGFDVVLLRNVVFYFDQPTRERVLRTVTQAVRTGGLLVLGRAEAAATPGPEFRLIGPGAYRKGAS